MSQKPSDEQPVETLIQYHGLDDFTDSLHRKPGYVPAAVNIVDEQIGDANRRQGRDLERLMSEAILNIFQFNFSDGTDALIVNGYFDFTQNNRTLTQSNAAGPYPGYSWYLPFSKTSDLPDFSSFFRELSRRRKYTNSDVDDIDDNVTIRSQYWGIDVYEKTGEDQAGDPIKKLIISDLRDKNAILNYKSKGFILARNKSYPSVAPPTDLSDMPEDFYWVDYFCDASTILLDLQTVVYIYNYVLSFYLKTSTINGAAYGSLANYASWSGGPSGADAYIPTSYSFSDKDPDTNWVNIQKKVYGLISSNMRRVWLTSATETILVTKSLYVQNIPLPSTPFPLSDFISVVSQSIGSVEFEDKAWAYKSSGEFYGKYNGILLDGYVVTVSTPVPPDFYYAQVSVSKYDYSIGLSSIEKYETLTADWYIVYSQLDIPSASISGGTAANTYYLWKKELALSDSTQSVTDSIANAAAIKAAPYISTIFGPNLFNKVSEVSIILNCPPLFTTPEPNIRGPTAEIFSGSASGTELDSSTETPVNWGSVVLGVGAANRSVYQGNDGDVISFSSTTLSFAANTHFKSNRANFKPCVLSNLSLGLSTLTGSPTAITIYLYINGNLVDQRSLAYSGIISNQNYCFSIKGYGDFSPIRPPQNDRSNDYDGWQSPVLVQVKLKLDSGTAIVNSATFFDLTVNYGF